MSKEVDVEIRLTGIHNFGVSMQEAQVALTALANGIGGTSSRMYAIDKAETPKIKCDHCGSHRNHKNENCRNCGAS